VKGAIDFTHRTFQEFLAAKAVVDADDIPLLVQHTHDDQWREVVLLTIGLASRTVRENLVELGRDEKTSSFTLILAGCCLHKIAREEMKKDIRLRIFKAVFTPLSLKKKGYLRKTKSYAREMQAQDTSFYLLMVVLILVLLAGGS
jgi:hypothetical protein